MLAERLSPPESSVGRDYRRDALAWARDKASIVHPVRGRIPFAPYPYQEDFLQDRARRRIIVKARQIGWSQAVAIEAAHKALYNPDSTILLVSRNQELAANLLKYCNDALDGVRDEAMLTKENSFELEFGNGSRIKSLPANRSTGRGFAAGDVYLDEYAFQVYAANIYRSVSPAVGHGGRLTVFSTPDGRANHFYQLWAGIEGGEWSRYTVPWHQCPAYDQAWYDRERPGYTAADWASEYECDFIASGDAVFRDADIALCADGWTGLASKRDGGRYVTAWDIGRRQDATVGITLEISTGLWQVVAWERHLGMSYPLIQQKIEQRHVAYPGEHWVESNGVGDPVIENLNVHVEPFTTTHKSKAQAITALALAHENHTLKHNVPQLKLECQLYQWDDKDLIQDSVMAAAIAAVAASRYTPPALVSIDRQPVPPGPMRQLFGRMR